MARRVDLVCCVYLIALVHLVSFVQPNKRDKPNKPNNGFLLLAGFFSILLGLKKVKMISRSRSVTDCQAMAKSFGEVGFGRLYGVVHGFASCEVRRDS